MIIQSLNIKNTGGVVLKMIKLSVNCLPISTIDSMATKNNPCKILVSELSSVKNGCVSLFLDIKSNKINKVDCIAIPPKIFPTAKSILPAI